MSDSSGIIKRLVWDTDWVFAFSVPDVYGNWQTGTWLQGVMFNCGNHWVCRSICTRNLKGWPKGESSWCRLPRLRPGLPIQEWASHPDGNKILANYVAPQHERPWEDNDAVYSAFLFVKRCSFDLRQWCIITPFPRTNPAPKRGSSYVPRLFELQFMFPKASRHSINALYLEIRTVR